jgi:pyruvate kinase
VVGLFVVLLAKVIVNTVYDFLGANAPDTQVGGEALLDGENVFLLAVVVISNILDFVALFAVIAIIIAGLYMILTGGAQADRAKQIIIWTIIGLVVILLAKVIVLTVYSFLGADMKSLRDEMKKRNYRARIIAKIETQMAIDNMDEILDASDGVMVARGDLGIELPYPQVPYYQKVLIKKCIERGIPVITATQMLQSMVDKPYPSRAEVSDIANAVFDNTDAVMLSEETASGKYPLKAVETQAKTASYIESHSVSDIRLANSFQIDDQETMVTDAAYNLLVRMDRKDAEIGGFIVFTQTGRTARMISRYRPRVPIYAFTPDEHISGMLTLSYAVYPVIQPEIYKRNSQVTAEDVQEAMKYLQKKDLVKKDKYYIVLHGDAWMIEGKTSTIKIIAPQN